MRCNSINGLTYKISVKATVLILFVFSSTACGKVYYVDPNGNDNNTGGGNSPFATIQKAIDEAKGGKPNAYDVIKVAPGTYLTGPIYLNNDNQEIIFASGVEVQAKKNDASGGPKAFSLHPRLVYEGDCLFKARSRKNIILRGDGTIFRMRKSEYEAEKNPGEGRHVISLKSCCNIKITGVTLKDSGGDGIIIEADYHSPEKKYFCKDIVIENVICDNNRRNGISVISVDGLTIDGCILKNTKGTAPQCGIDFEPDYKGHRLSNIVMRNTTIKNNVGVALFINCSLRGSDLQNISMVFEDIRVQDGHGIWVAYLRDDGPDGSIKFKNLIIENTTYGTLIFKSFQKVDLSFENCVWKNLGPNNYPIKIQGFKPYMTSPGGVQFTNCQVIDDVDRPAIKLDRTGNHSLHHIHGDLYVENNKRKGAMYDWGGAELDNVDITIHSGLAGFYNTSN